MNENGLLDYLALEIKKLFKEETVIICLIGGPGSGKTTLSKKISAKLGSADVISTDDYVIGDRQFRREKIEGQDPLLKYDFKFMNKKIDEIKSLSDDEVVKVPTYDENTGIAIAQGEDNYSHKISKINFLIIEGDFQIVSNPDLVIFLDVEDKVRLSNRINRDKITRNESETEKIKENFELRQKLQFIPHTLPVRDTADIIVKSSIDTETGLYRYQVFQKTAI